MGIFRVFNHASGFSDGNVGRFLLHLGQDLNIFSCWVSMKLVHGPQIINPTGFGDRPTFLFVPTQT